MHPSNCLNCQAPFAQNDNFCATCGQKTNLHRLSIGHIIHEAIHFFLHADKSIFTLVKKLATKTGTVAKEFIAGKQKRYFPPLSFFLVIIGLVVLSMSFFTPLQVETNSNTEQLMALVQQIPDPVKKAHFLGLVKRQAQVSVFTKKYSNILAMCALPLVSFIFYLCYRRNKYNYAEHVVANLYGVGFTSLVLGIIFIPLMSLTNLKGYFIGLGAYFIFEIIYRSIYYTRLLDKKGAGAFFKALGVAVLAQVTWIALTMSLLFWYIKSGFGGLFA